MMLATLIIHFSTVNSNITLIAADDEVKFHHRNGHGEQIQILKRV